MAVLPDSGLRTITEGGTGQAQVLTDNFQDIDSNLTGPFQADNALGSLQVANASANNAQELTNSTGGTPSDTISGVGATYSQSEVNDALASLTDEINNLRQDRDALETKVNELLAVLRKTNGCGVLDD